MTTHHNEASEDQVHPEWFSERIADDPEALAAIAVLIERGYTGEDVAEVMQHLDREAKP